MWDHPDCDYSLGIAAHTYEWVLTSIREEFSTLRDVEIKYYYFCCQSHYYCDHIDQYVVADITCGVVSVQSLLHHCSFFSSLSLCEEGRTNWERVKAKGLGGKILLPFLKPEGEGLSAVGAELVSSRASFDCPCLYALGVKAMTAPQFRCSKGRLI